MIDVKKRLREIQMQKDYNLISIPQITLNPEEADRFLDCIEDESVMKDYARIERMNRREKTIRHLGFGDRRFLYPANHFNESKYKKEWVQNPIVLRTEELRGALAIFDSDLEDVAHIENPNKFKNHLIAIATKKIANELEEISWISDTNNIHSTWAVDDARGIFDGWRYIITHAQTATGNLSTYYNTVCGSSHVKEACACQSGSSCPSGQAGAGAHFKYPGMIAEQNPNAPYDWEFKYHMMIKNMPSKYKARYGLANMAFLNSDLVTQDYLGALSSRATALGDAIFTGQVPPAYGKVKIIDVPLMPTNLGQDTHGTYGLIGAGDYTDVLMTFKGNLIIGIQRDIKIEYWRVPPDQATYIFYTLRVAYAIENVNAIVLLICLEHEC